MLNMSQKRTFVKISLLGLSLASFSVTKGMLSSIFAYPLPVLTGYTVLDLFGAAGLIAVYLLHKREV